MNPESTRSDDDMRRIIEVLQAQVSTMKTELDDMKSKITKVEDRGTVMVTEPVTEPETREEVIEYLKKIPGIGLSKADLLYDEGFDSTGKLKSATEEDFKHVRGIGPSLAKKMVKSIEAIEKGEDLAAKEEEPAPAAAEPPKPEGGGAMGFFKNTYSKVLGFFKGKKPAPSEQEPPKPEGELKDEKTEVGTEEEPLEKEEESKEEAEGSVEPEEDSKTEPEEGASAEESKIEEEPEGASLDTESTGGVEITAEEPREPTKEDIIASYAKLEGVSEDIAGALYKAGYETMVELKEAQAEDLQMVPGIDANTAETIVRALKES